MSQSLEVERIRQRVQAGMAAKAYDDVVSTLDQAVTAGHKEFYGLRLNFWFADQWGPWPWDQMDQMLSELAERDSRAWWLKAKVAVHLGIDVYDYLERGIAAGDVSCRMCLAVISLMDNNVNFARELFSAPTVSSVPFARTALQLLDLLPVESSRHSMAPVLGLTRIDHFVHPVVCNWLVREWQPLAAPAAIVDPKTGASRLDPYRRSDVAAVFGPRQDPVSVRLQARIAFEVQLPTQCFEPLSYIRYAGAQEYRPHFDGFPEGHPQLQIHKGGQRIKTALLYLGDKCTGGETDFPRLGLSIAPKKGTLVVFSNAMDDGLIDPQSLHAGKPVISGEKHIVTQWIRQFPTGCENDIA